MNYFKLEDPLHKRSPFQMRRATERSSRINRTFFQMVHDPDRPLSDDHLRRLISHRPEIWERFAGYVGRLSEMRANRSSEWDRL